MDSAAGGAPPIGGASRFFRFVQFEFPWELGPADGRYVIRGHAAEISHVLVVGTLGAAPRRGLVRRRRPVDAEPEPDPTPVVTVRVTLISPEPFADERAATAWRKEADVDEEVDGALVVLNRVLHMHRTATADPYVREVAREQAICIRLGVGEGEQVSQGRWTDAVELPPPKPRRESRGLALRPQERLAALLGGRDVPLASEELVLRARLDIDAGRHREAALQLRVALEAALSELTPWAERAAIAQRLDKLREERKAVGAAANRALEGGLDEETCADVERITRLVEAVLRTRTAAGFE